MRDIIGSDFLPIPGFPTGNDFTPLWLLHFQLLFLYVKVKLLFCLQWWWKLGILVLLFLCYGTILVLELSGLSFLATSETWNQMPSFIPSLSSPIVPRWNWYWNLEGQIELPFSFLYPFFLFLLIWIGFINVHRKVLAFM